MREMVGRLAEEAPRFGVSVVVHALVLLLLYSITIDAGQRKQIVKVISDVVEERKPEDFIEIMEEEQISLDAEVSLSPTASNVDVTDDQLATAAAPALQELSGQAVAFDRTLNRPLMGNSTDIPLGGNIEGMAGITVAATGGDAGAVDQITLEILRQLDKSKVLVAWVMDSSGSLNTRREAIIKRFDRVYHELKVVGEKKHREKAALVTGIVAFGGQTVFVTPKPTEDMEEVKKAVRSIKVDESGDENVFTAVKETALKWRKYQTHGRYKLMMVVLTDEKGDDPSLLDDTVDLVKRNRVPVYILGPMAPFGRKTVSMRWVDEPTGEAFYFPVDRGPETVQPEHLNLPYWYNGPQYNLFSSGFGPYALTRLARESGGIYFMFDDGTIPGPKFNIYDLLEYAPDYVSHSEYLRAMGGNPLRAAVIRAAQQSEGSRGQPVMQFPAANLNPQLTRAQRTVAATMHFVERALASLRSVEKYRSEETSRRWQAHFDLMMGRLMAHKVRCNEYNWALAQMKTDPLPLKGEGKNAWRLVGDNTISFGKKAAGDDKKKSRVRGSDARANQKAQEEAELALTYLRRVVKEHPGTPWAMMAERELQAPLGFKWVEHYIQPPEERERDPQRAARNKRRQDAMKRIPKGL